MLTAKDRALGCRPFRTRSLHLPLPLVSKDRIVWELIKSNTRACSARASSSYASVRHFCIEWISFTCDLDFADGFKGSIPDIRYFSDVT